MNMNIYENDGINVEVSMYPPLRNTSRLVGKHFLQPQDTTINSMLC